MTHDVHPVQRPDEAQPRIKELRARYGKPATAPNKADILRLLGKRDGIHPHDVVAVRYSCMDEALQYAELNRTYYNNDTIGPIETAEGVFSALDLRRALRLLAEAGDRPYQPADPSLPDGWPRSAATSENSPHHRNQP